MATRARSRGALPVTGGTVARDRLKDAMRALVSMTTPGEAGVAHIDAGNTSEGVLVDADVDGDRYLLVRMPRALHKHVVLSPREHEIVRMVAQGHPNKIIADILSISSWTVCTHLRRIFAKL